MKRSSYILIATLMLGLVAVGCSSGDSTTPAVQNDSATGSAATMEVSAMSSTVNQGTPTTMKSTLSVSGGGVGDYVIVGMMSAATDGHDNAYDTYAPAEGMGDYQLSSYISHPEWNGVKSQYRGDIRSLQNTEQEWTVNVETDLPAGTPVTVSLVQGKSQVDGNYALTVQDMATSSTTDIKSDTYTFDVTAGARQLKVNAAYTGTETSYSVSGTLTDQGTGAALAGTRVELSNSSFSVVGTTDGSGEFTLSGVPAGNYTLGATQSGYTALSTSYSVN